MYHIFDTEVAKEYGVLAATIFESIARWCHYNETNGTNFHDGKYWTYNSIKAYELQFPYATNKQIRLAIERLIKSDLITAGNYNQMPYDRTLWYSLTEKGYSIFHRGQRHLPHRANGNADEGEPIPYDYHMNNHMNNHMNTHNTSNRFVKPTPQEVTEYSKSKGCLIDGEEFCDFYESKDWMIGKNKMKDWKAAVRTWIKNSNKKKPSKTKSDIGSNDYKNQIDNAGVTADWSVFDV